MINTIALETIVPVELDYYYDSDEILDLVGKRIKSESLHYGLDSQHTPHAFGGTDFPHNPLSFSTLLKQYEVIHFSSPTNQKDYRYNYMDFFLFDGKQLHLAEKIFNIIPLDIYFFDVKNSDLIFAKPYPSNFPFCFQWEHQKYIDEMARNFTVNDIAVVGYTTSINFTNGKNLQDGNKGRLEEENQKWNILIVDCIEDFLSSSPHYNYNDLITELRKMDSVRCYPGLIFESFFPGRLLPQKTGKIDIEKTIVVSLTSD